MNILGFLLILVCFVADSLEAPIHSDEPVNKVDQILAEWWKVGDRWHYTTLSAIKETECEYVFENLKQIQDFFGQKYSSNPLVMKVVDILVKGKERYLKEEVCNIVDVVMNGDILLIQAMEINDSFKKLQPIRKNFTDALVGATQANSNVDLSHILCLTKLWAKQTVNKTSKFFKTQQRIKKWFELNIDPIMKLFESSGYKIAATCDLKKIADHSKTPKPKSIEMLLIDAFNILTAASKSGSEQPKQVKLNEIKIYLPLQ